MKTPAYWGVSGFPISHSLTPKIFNIVGDALNLDTANMIFIEAKNPEEFKKNIDNLEGDLWISVTSPLKHTLGKILEISEFEGVNSINQLTRINGEWEGTNTDGYGFVNTAKYIGINPQEAILKIKGGGSTARSIAAAWSEAGGKIILINGRRELTAGPWNKSIIEDCYADIAIDLETEPGQIINKIMKANMTVTLSYNEHSKINDFALIMLVSQHLEAWNRLFINNISSKLPTLDYVLERLFD